MSEQKQPTCFDCIYAVIIPGTAGNYLEPPDPTYVDECKNENVSEELFQDNWNEDDMPQKCGGFKPKLIKKCGNKECNKEMNVPKWSWELWATTMWEYIPVCSEECKQEVEDQDEMEQLQDEGYAVGIIKGTNYKE